MSLKIDNRNYLSLLSSPDLSGDIFGEAVTIERLYGFCVYVKWSGAPVGSFSLQASIDPNDPTKFNQIPVNWETIECSPTAVNGPGSQMWNVDAAYFRYFRLVYTATSGTGTIEVCQFMTKGP